MNAIRKLGYASAAAIALATSSGAAAADYLYNLQFDAVTSGLGNFGASDIVFTADNLDPTLLTYVSGDVNGATSPQLFRSVTGATQRGFEFPDTDFSVPVGAIANIFFSASAPFTLGMTQETTLAGRGVRTSNGAFYVYTTGRLTITERIAAVPEPATWATLIVGFLAVGGTLRRRTAVRKVRVAYS